MNKGYVLLRGVMCMQYASRDAGLELVRVLHSEDPNVVSLACSLLEETDTSA